MSESSGRRLQTVGLSAFLGVGLGLLSWAIAALVFLLYDDPNDWFAIGKVVLPIGVLLAGSVLGLIPTTIALAGRRRGARLALLLNAGTLLLVLCAIAGILSPSCTRAIADWQAAPG